MEVAGLSDPFIPVLMSPISSLYITSAPPPKQPFSHRLEFISFYYFFSIWDFSFSVHLGVRVTVPHLKPLPIPSLICLFFSLSLPPFRNSLSIALLTATHQPECNLKSPSTAAIPRGWLSVQLPKPRQGLCFSKQLWTSGWFPQFQMDWRWKTLFLKDWFIWRQGDWGGIFRRHP